MSARSCRKQNSYAGRNALRVTSFTLLILTAHPAALQADNSTEIFQWIDENGGVHFGDRPAEQPVKKIYIRKSGHPDPAYQSQLEQQFKLLKILTEDRIEQQQLNEKQRKTEATRVANCNVAKQTLDSIRTASYLYESTDDPYNPRVLTSEERAAETARAEAAVTAWCR